MKHDNLTSSRCLHPVCSVTLTADRDLPEETKEALGTMIKLATEALARGDFDDCPQCGKSCDMHAVWCPTYNEDADDE